MTGERSSTCKRPDETSGEPLPTPGRKQLPQQRGHGSLLSAASGLSDAHLLGRVLVLAGGEREATVELLAHLAELDRRKLYLAEGHGSLFSYCTGALRLAEHAAYNRIEAARASREFPVLLDLLAEGSLNLATVRLLAPHLRPDSFDALVTSASGKSKRDVEVLVACLAPRPDVASSVRKLPERGFAVTGGAAAGGSGEIKPIADAPGVDASTLGSAMAVPETQGMSTSGPGPLMSAPATSLEQSTRCAVLDPLPAAGLESPACIGSKSALLDRPADRPVVAPLAPARYRVQFTVGEATHEKLRRAQDLLRREIPDGDPGAIFDRALTLLLEDVARKKLAETSKPRPAGPPSTRSRHIPAHVRRAVWLRDGGRCAFVAANGRRCTERAFLEFHHHEPYAIGGEATEANIALRCRRHNIYEAELAFGPATASDGHDAHTGVADSPRGESGASHGSTTPAPPRDRVVRPGTPSIPSAALAGSQGSLSVALAGQSG